MIRSNLLGAEIKKSLYLQGKNQIWLAKQVGISGCAISSIICGRSKPSQRTLKNIAEALSLSTEKLVGFLLDDI